MLLNQETVLYTEMFYIHLTVASSQCDLLGWNQINQVFLKCSLGYNDNFPFQIYY